MIITWLRRCPRRLCPIRPCFCEPQLGVINKSGPTFRQPKGLGLPVAAALGTLGGQCFDLAERRGRIAAALVQPLRPPLAQGSRERLLRSERCLGRGLGTNGGALRTNHSTALSGGVLGVVSSGLLIGRPFVLWGLLRYFRQSRSSLCAQIALGLAHFIPPPSLRLELRLAFPTPSTPSPKAQLRRGPLREHRAPLSQLCFLQARCRRKARKISLPRLEAFDTTACEQCFD